MNRRIPRALTALCAAAVSVAASLIVAAPAFADAPTTVYVDATTGSNGYDCLTAETACQTITQALSLVAAGGTVDVAGGPYAEDLAPDKSVTLAGTNATLDGTLDVHAASVEISGFTFTGSSPQVHIDDPNATDSVAVHNDTFSGSGGSPVAIDGNAATTSITDNTIASTADGIDVTAGGSDGPYTIAGNQFSLGGGSGTAIALSAADPDVLSAEINSNSGTISATGHAITRSGNVSVTTTGTGNSITSAGTSLVADPVPLSLITEQAPTAFDTVATSDLDLTGATYDLALATTGGITAGDVTLQYSTDGKNFLTLDLSGGGASLPTGVGIPSAGTTTVYFRIAVGPSAPSGTITLTASIDEPGGAQRINSFASTPITATVQANRAPTAAPQSVSVPRNATQPITLVGNDPDPGDVVTGYTLDRTGLLGSVTQSPTDPSQVSYTPPTNFSGTDTFAFSVVDDHGNVSAGEATVTVTVGPKIGPVAADISLPASSLMSHGSANPIELAGAQTDSDTNSFVYSVRPVDGLTGGNVSIDPDHPTRALYTPDASTAGRQVFQYRVFDGTDYSNWAMVSFTVDSPPKAISQPGPAGLEISHTSANPLPIPTLTAEDADIPTGDVLHFSVPTSGVGYPSHGRLSGNAPDSLEYTPNSDYTGQDQFRFTVTDSYGASSTAVVTIMVTDQPPIAADASPRIPYAVGRRTIQLPGSDPDSDPVTYALGPNAPAFLALDQNTGVVTVNQTGTHEQPFTFTYTVTDVLEGSPQTSDVGTVSVAVNTPPVAQAVTLPVGFGKAASGTAQATDADHDPITSFSFGQPAHGKLASNAGTGAFTYTPNTGYAGTDSFSYTVADAMDSSAPATVSITVSPASTSMTMTMTPLRPTSADHPTVTVRVNSAGNELGGLVTIRTGGFGTPSARVNSNGVATVRLPQFPGGPKNITAVFGGTNTAAPVSSNPLNFTVTRVASKIGYRTTPLQLTTRTSNATATITVTAGPFHPSGGTVTIDENGNRLAQGTPKVGVVTLRLPRFSLGQHNLTVSYTGTPFITASSVIEVERVGLG